MNRRSLLKFLLSAPAAAAVGLGTLIGKKKVLMGPQGHRFPPPYSVPFFHDWDCEPNGRACTPGCRTRNLRIDPLDWDVAPVSRDDLDDAWLDARVAGDKEACRRIESAYRDIPLERISEMEEARTYYDFERVVGWKVQQAHYTPKKGRHHGSRTRQP